METRIWKADRDGGSTTYNGIWFTVGLAAAYTETYGWRVGIARASIKAEMLPHNMGGTLSVNSLGEGNDMDNPVKDEIVTEEDVGGIVAGAAIGAVVDGLAMPLGGPAGIAIGFLVDLATGIFFEWYGEDPNNEPTNIAYGTTSSYYTLVEWDYTDGLYGDRDNPRPDTIGVSNDFYWKYDASRTDLSLKITATIDWCYLEYCGFAGFCWLPDGSTTLTTYINV
jgi:hypothetical protein